MRALPESLRGYQRSWLSTDLLAGLTLATVVIPQVLGYTYIAQTPLATGLYTVIFPTIVFALLGSSRLLVVGADSATAVVLASGLAGLGIAGLRPYSAQWVAWAALVALVCGAMLLVARLLRFGFIGDFLSASVRVGFLSGVGIQVLITQVPAMMGVPTPSDNWFQQQLDVVKAFPQTSLMTFAFAVGTVVLITALQRFAPKAPGALVAVVVSIVISLITDAAAHGVAVIGSVPREFPPVGLPQGLSWAHVPHVLGLSFACFVLIVTQSAATSRSFAAAHGQRVDINRDILALSAANIAAGLSGTFVVNGSPTMTQFLDRQRGRTQLANLIMSGVVLAFVLLGTGLLTNMPKAVLAGIVFMIGVSLIDIAELRRIQRRRVGEFVIACTTGFVVFAFGVEQGIVLAIVLSILEIIRRAYRPKDFVVSQSLRGNPTFMPATPGAQSLPGLVVFRFDAQLFYANASRFTDDVQAVMAAAPDKVHLLVLDCSALDDVDYTAGLALSTLVDYVHQQGARFAIARADDELLSTLSTYGILEKIAADHIFANLSDAFTAYQSDAQRWNRG